MSMKVIDKEDVEKILEEAAGERRAAGEVVLADIAEVDL